jgi:hypothetical protein
VSGEGSLVAVVIGEPRSLCLLFNFVGRGLANFCDKNEASVSVCQVRVFSGKGLCYRSLK